MTPEETDRAGGVRLGEFVVGAGADRANQVRLRGRVSTPPQRRVLPSGTEIVTLRLSVAREPSPMATGSRQTTDWFDCSVWGGRLRRTVAGWREGDLVQVEGALRRRFYRAGGGTATRVEVEVLRGRVTARAGRAGRPPG
jgi:single-strand DNA-binding protein